MSAETYETPAEMVINKFGVRPLARMIGVSPSSVINWRTKGGLIPSRHQATILNLAAERGLHITPRMVIYGRTTRDANAA